MKVDIIQPNFLPWCGYFGFIREVHRSCLRMISIYRKENMR